LWTVALGRWSFYGLAFLCVGLIACTLRCAIASQQPLVILIGWNLFESIRQHRRINGSVVGYFDSSDFQCALMTLIVKQTGLPPRCTSGGGHACRWHCHTSTCCSVFSFAGNLCRQSTLDPDPTGTQGDLFNKGRMLTQAFSVLSIDKNRKTAENYCAASSAELRNSRAFISFFEFGKILNFSF